MSFKIDDEDAHNAAKSLLGLERISSNPRKTKHHEELISEVKDRYPNMDIDILRKLSSASLNPLLKGQKMNMNTLARYLSPTEITSFKEQLRGPRDILSLSQKRQLEDESRLARAEHLKRQKIAAVIHNFPDIYSEEMLGKLSIHQLSHLERGNKLTVHDGFNLNSKDRDELGSQISRAHEIKQQPVVQFFGGGKKYLNEELSLRTQDDKFESNDFKLPQDQPWTQVPLPVAVITTFRNEDEEIDFYCQNRALYEARRCRDNKDTRENVIQKYENKMNGANVIYNRALEDYHDAVRCNDEMSRIQCYNKMDEARAHRDFNAKVLNYILYLQPKDFVRS